MVAFSAKKKTPMFASLAKKKTQCLFVRMHC
jgi:hypothetical protein